MSIDVITESLVTLGEAVLQPVGDRDSWGGLSGMMSRPLGRHDVSSKGGEGYSPSPPLRPDLSLAGGAPATWLNCDGFADRPFQFRFASPFSRCRIARVVFD